MRVRTISFENDERGRERFSLLYQGFLTGGNSPAPKGIEIIRREDRLLTKFENISDEKDETRTLKNGGGSFQVDQAEFDLLRRYFESTPWTTRMAHKVIDVTDWLASLPNEESGG